MTHNNNKHEYNSNAAKTGQINFASITIDFGREKVANISLGRKTEKKVKENGTICGNRLFTCFFITLFCFIVNCRHNRKKSQQANDATGNDKFA